MTRLNKWKWKIKVLENLPHEPAPESMKFVDLALLSQKSSCKMLHKTALPKRTGENPPFCHSWSKETAAKERCACGPLSAPSESGGGGGGGGGARQANSVRPSRSGRPLGLIQGGQIRAQIYTFSFLGLGELFFNMLAVTVAVFKFWTIRYYWVQLVKVWFANVALSGIYPATFFICWGIR